jgi:large subunit ribosomal protein L25
MRKDITVAVEPRASRGKNEARRLRVAGRIPAVVYGSGGDSVAVAVNPKELNRILHSASGHNTIFNLDVGGRENTPVMVVDWQLDPVSDRLLHADLKRIDLDKPLRVKIPVHTKGDPKGVKQQGGLLELVTREIEVECLPNDIPEHLTVDVTELLIHQNLRARDVTLSGSMKLVSPPEAVICHVIAIRVEEKPVEEAAAVTPAATAEPEVIKKGKKEEEGAAAETKEKEKKKK